MDLQALEGVPDLIKAVEFGVRALADGSHFTLGTILDLALGVGPSLSLLQLLEIGLQLLGALFDGVVATVL